MAAVFKTLSIPARAHPLVRRLFEEMNHKKVTLMSLSRKSGVNKNTLRHWRTKSEPRISDLDACYAVVGLKLYAGVDFDRLAPREISWKGEVADEAPPHSEDR